MHALIEIWQYRDLIFNLVQRDLKVRYKNSVLGVIWSWLNPLLMMLIFTFVFNVLWTRSDIPNYHILFLSGQLPWRFFQESVMSGVNSVTGSAHLVKKIYFPREVLPISNVLSALANFLIALPVLFLLAWLSKVPVTTNLLLLPIPIVIQVIFTMGLVLLLSALEVYYRDTHMLMDVVIQAWFFLTPIIYPITQIPPEITILGITFNPRVWLFRLNPMASIINTYQDIVYYGTLTDLDFLSRTAVTSLIVLVVGYWSFRKLSNKFGEVV